MMHSRITVAKMPPVMTTVPAVIRPLLHQQPAVHTARLTQGGNGGAGQVPQGLPLQPRSPPLREGMPASPAPGAGAAVVPGILALGLALPLTVDGALPAGPHGACVLTRTRTQPS